MSAEKPPRLKGLKVQPLANWVTLTDLQYSTGLTVLVRIEQTRQGRKSGTFADIVAAFSQPQTLEMKAISHDVEQFDRSAKVIPVCICLRRLWRNRRRAHLIYIVR